MPVTASKPFLSYDQQVDKLETEKGLTIDDREYAIRLLKEHSYYSLISGYKKPFKQDNGKYKDAVTISDIYALYVFDDNLRHIVLRGILTVERLVKSLIAYAFCEKYGEDQAHYLDRTKYDNTPSKQADVFKLIDSLGAIHADDKKYPYVSYQIKRHGNAPLWVMTKALTLGSVSKMYELLTHDVKAAVSKEFFGIREDSLGEMLDFLSRIRNVCAHNERLYNYSYDKSRIKKTGIHAYFGNAGTMGRRDLFAVMISLKYLMPHEPFVQMISGIETELNTLLSRTKHLSKAKMYKEMGVPNNWKKLKDLKV